MKTVQAIRRDFTNAAVGGKKAMCRADFRQEEYVISDLMKCRMECRCLQNLVRLIADTSLQPIPLPPSASGCADTGVRIKVLTLIQYLILYLPLDYSPYPASTCLTSFNLILLCHAVL